MDKFLEPFRAGVELSGTTHCRTDDELMVDEAALLDLFDCIEAARPTRPPPAATAAAAAASAAPSSSSSASEKKELPKNYWADFIKDFESMVGRGGFPRLLWQEQRPFWPEWYTRRLPFRTRQCSWVRS